MFMYQWNYAKQILSIKYTVQYAYALFKFNNVTCSQIQSNIITIANTVALKHAEQTGYNHFGRKRELVTQLPSREKDSNCKKKQCSINYNWHKHTCMYAACTFITCDIHECTCSCVDIHMTYT